MLHEILYGIPADYEAADCDVEAIADKADELKDHYDALIDEMHKMHTEDVDPIKYIGFDNLMGAGYYGAEFGQMMGFCNYLIVMAFDQGYKKAKREGIAAQVLCGEVAPE